MTFLLSFSLHTVSDRSELVGYKMIDRAWMADRKHVGPVVITVDILERCLDRMALLITESGDKGVAYLPVYERLETELAELAAKQDRMARIRARIRR
jgi:hypothetical protein